MPLPITPSEIRDRHRLGLDARDEEWEGVYHMTPAPSVAHQRLLAGLIRILGDRLERRGGGTILPDINVFRESAPQLDYRIPDLVFVAAGHEHLIARDGIRGGPPDAVIELLSPGDETYAKLDFYAALGVPEVVIVEPESRKPEVLSLAAGKYVWNVPDSEGRLRCDRLGIFLRPLPGTPPLLEIADVIDGSGGPSAL